MQLKDFTAVAQLGKKHGFKGAYRYHNFVGFNILKLQLYCRRGGTFIPLGKKTIKVSASLISAPELFGITEEAGLSRNLYCRSSTLPSLPRNYYYYKDLLHKKVRGCGGCYLGKVSNILELKSNSVLEVRTCKGATLFVPFVKKYIFTVNEEILTNWELSW